jgi:hypothetical protein
MKMVIYIGLAAVMFFVGFRLYRAYGDQAYSAAVTRFTTSDNAVDMEFIVRVPTSGLARCVVRARDTTGSEIGRATVEVPAGPEPSRTVMRYRLATTGRPVTGEVAGCTPAPVSTPTTTRP